MTDVWLVVPDSEIAPVHRMNGREWVRVVAHIRSNATKEVRRYKTTELLENGEESIRTYGWEEGNFSCDCNREDFFRRAGNEEEGDAECGDERYAVNLENPATGEIFYREFE